eukprot:TRINITY_DN613_c0_g1_i1.p1 TRINITY_DN613_c0_g1~~TRINITY_DN613_c0_g1_i1.p1  ORF type:complete len:475 (+),score=190.95 TRINITY_DN613_c0_g1_i1:90-1514(+)
MPPFTVILPRAVIQILQKNQVFEECHFEYSSTGPPHKPVWSCELTFTIAKEMFRFTSEESTMKKKAETDACEAAITILMKRFPELIVLLPFYHRPTCILPPRPTQEKDGEETEAEVKSNKRRAPEGEAPVEVPLRKYSKTPQKCRLKNGLHYHFIVDGMTSPGVVGYFLNLQNPIDYNVHLNVTIFFTHEAMVPVFPSFVNVVIVPAGQREVLENEMSFHTGRVLTACTVIDLQKQIHALNSGSCPMSLYHTLVASPAPPKKMETKDEKKKEEKEEEKEEEEGNEKKDDDENESSVEEAVEEDRDEEKEEEKETEEEKEEVKEEEKEEKEEDEDEEKETEEEKEEEEVKEEEKEEKEENEDEENEEEKEEEEIEIPPGLKKGIPPPPAHPLRASTGPATPVHPSPPTPHSSVLPPPPPRPAHNHTVSSTPENRRWVICSPSLAMLRIVHLLQEQGEIAAHSRNMKDFFVTLNEI